jgi:ABC-2 type transport system ATP-binding protein
VPPWRLIIGIALLTGIMLEVSRRSIIEVHSLDAPQKARVNAVDGVSFTVAPGELFALLGPNGAGKTTTIAILTTTLLPTTGTVLVAGHDVAREASAVRRKLGIIFQNPSLDLNLTAEENVRFHAILYGLYPFRPTFRSMPQAYKNQVLELAAILGLAENIFQSVRTFSGGMKRKLEIVRSLIHRPQVLFLDEPTTGLDAASRRNLWAYLQDTVQRDGITFF